MFGWLKRNRENQRRREEEMIKIEWVLNQISLREPTSGPDARPWKERPTSRPQGLDPANWKDRWIFAEPNEVGLISIPEEAVGAIFPGDTVAINGVRWFVTEIINEYEWPIARVQRTT